MLHSTPFRILAAAALAAALLFVLSIPGQPALASRPALFAATETPTAAAEPSATPTPADSPTATPTAAVETEAVALTPPAAAAASAVTGSISVSGSAQVMVAPDEVVLVLGVETHDFDLAAAKQQNDEIVKKVLDLTTQYAIDPKYVQTDFVNIEPRYDSVYQEKVNFVGYFVRKTIEVRLQDVTKFESFYADMLGAGVTHVQGIEFRTTELRKYRDQARELALKAAREKAEAMAGVYGQSVGQVKSITENNTGWWGSYNSWWGSYGGAMSQNVVQNAGPSSSFTEDETLAPGQIAVSANVSVEFELLR